MHFFFILLTFIEILKVVVINKTAILVMSANFANPSLLKIKFVWNKSYDIIISAHDITNKILTRNWKYIAGVIIWPKFGNSSIYMREVQFDKDMTRKTNFFEGWSYNNNWELVLGMSLKFYSSVAKCSEAIKFWGVIPTSRNGRKTGKAGGGSFCLLSWIGLRKPDT